jgi:hypothetical protein
MAAHRTLSNPFKTSTLNTTPYDFYVSGFWVKIKDQSPRKQNKRQGSGGTSGEAMAAHRTLSTPFKTSTLNTLP